MNVITTHVETEPVVSTHMGDILVNAPLDGQEPNVIKVGYQSNFKDISKT